MAQFEVRMHRLAIEPHPDADRLEIARILGYRCVVPLGQFKTGDVAAYIPEQSIVPQDILQEMGLEGKLAGANKDRVRAQRLRGVLSQGLVYGGKKIAGAALKEGSDCTRMLGITKYEPPIPPEMSGSLESYAGEHRLLSYDVENIKNYPGRMRDGEPCEMHEKIHGTLCYCIVDAAGGSIRISSKGRASQQLVFADCVDNVYGRMCSRYDGDLQNLARTLLGCDNDGDNDDGGGTLIHILCEAYGRKVQDLTYGCDLDMAVFDAVIPPGPGGGVPMYVSQSAIRDALRPLSLRPAPLAYAGPFSESILDEHTSGPSLVEGSTHLREGVVIRPVPEREDSDGRVILKSVSPDYLCRKGGGTEYN